jgi:hypothetical protein
MISSAAASRKRTLELRKEQETGGSEETSNVARNTKEGL